MNHKFKILDCTLRDGGYYTNWDFSKKCVETYLNAIEDLPIDYIEVGYRSKPLDGYFGEYFYLPQYVMQEIQRNTSKKIAIILNEKDVRDTEVAQLLTICKPYVHTVRIAVDPNNFRRALQLAKSVRSLGFQVCFNLMYMSNWTDYPDLISRFNELDNVVDVLYMVDSYGGVYPEDVKRTYKLIKQNTSIKTGFHGHNNLELALINTLTAIECGVDFIDGTITGMGRGAGNLKTELLLTVLENKKHFSFDYNALSKVVDEFSILQKNYEWGTNLPYMVSGANSLPQKNVMEWVSKRFYSFNSIIRALTNKSKGQEDNLKLKALNFELEKDSTSSKCLIVGGGSSVTENAMAIETFLKSNPKVVVIHASSKNAMVFVDIQNPQYFCLVGNEGYRLESVFLKPEDVNGKCILPPYPRKMGTYIPKAWIQHSFELKEVSFTDQFKDSHTALALQTVIELKSDQILVVGYDGYSESIGLKEQELFAENEYMFKQFSKKYKPITSLTCTRYKQMRPVSIFALI